MLVRPLFSLVVLVAIATAGCERSPPAASARAHSPDETSVRVLKETCSEAVPGAAPEDPYRRKRSTTDLPDDHGSAFQVHVLYVEPSDRAATRELDTDGSIRRSVTAWNGWLSAQTGGPKLRVDTCGGVIDVTYVKLRSELIEAAMADGTAREPAGPRLLRERLEGELAPAFADPHKLYLVYYDGRALGSCGGAPLPPATRGHMAALYVGGLVAATSLVGDAAAGATQVSVASPGDVGFPSPPFEATLIGENVRVVGFAGSTATLAAPLKDTHKRGEVLQARAHPPDCRSNPLSADGQQLGHTEYAAVRETLHALGIVAPAAPDYAPPPASPGHLRGEPPVGESDLMYEGDAPWGCLAKPGTRADASPCKLDPRHRNYFRVPTSSKAIDLATSAFLDTPTGGAAGHSPPGW
jgi:hypothetical protein